jgi:signal transduction histidine kinase
MTTNAANRRPTLFSFRNKLILGFSLPIILIILLGIFNNRSIETVNAEYALVSEDITPLSIALENLRFSGLNIVSSTSEYVLLSSLGAEEEEGGGVSTELNQIVEAQAAYQEVFADYETLILEKVPDEVEELEDVRALGTILVDESNAILALVNEGASTDLILDAKEGLEEAEIEFLARIDTAIAIELEDLAAGHENVDAAILAGNTGVLIASIAAVVLSFGIASYIYFTTVTPLSRLETAAEGLRNARFDLRVPVTSQDEFGRLSETFNTMAAAIEYRDKEQIAKLETQLEETEIARAQAERSDQVKSSFLASMSHELRTPLNSVINFSKFLNRGMMGEVNEEQQETLGEIIEHSEHLLSLINDVLDMSKIESGSLNLFIEDEVNLGDILETVTTTTKSLIHEKPIALETEISPELPRLRGDRQRILQILLNIVSNAAKFTKEGRICIQAQSQGENVLITVTDSGMGIAQEDQWAVFEAFKQTTTGLRRGGGTGLGMPISKNLAEAHGGKLWFESESGKGTSFFVSLPIHSEALIPTI